MRRLQLTAAVCWVGKNQVELSLVEFESRDGRHVGGMNEDDRPLIT